MNKIRHTIYINDIINKDGLIDQTIILEKLMYKANWIA